MSAIVQYRLVSQLTPDALQKAVRGSIKDGWQPQGGVAITVGSVESSGSALHIQITYCQAMVR